MRKPVQPPTQPPAKTEPAPPDAPAPRARLAQLYMSVALRSGAHHAHGGDIWLEYQPFPHVRVGSDRYPMDRVVSWSLPSDVAKAAR